jgi:hypothetical protein
LADDGARAANVERLKLIAPRPGLSRGGNSASQFRVRLNHDWPV